MVKEITLTIDNIQVTVPEGTLIVDAAKMAGVTIPVFCYHPKLRPAGMCRVCLVDVGRPAVDRVTKEIIYEADGKPKIQFGAKLETACTTPVSEAMVVQTTSDKVKEARRDILEFLLTSHPLDCPVCDKGGECPLQNLTMAFGPDTSRFAFDEKMHLGKHMALGELILLDRERCIQCGRCVRFQNEVADDPAIGFYERGRSLEIVTFTEPGFDSIFSGNSTDICPVGALTTVDFHFGARPWELTPTASICNHCAVGCNIVYDVRREARSNGRTVIKRVMPRQNEAVNEVWICDKGRFGYHYTESDKRLMQPQVRKDGKLSAVTWEEALDLAASKIRNANAGLVTVVGGRLPNEDLFNLFRLCDAQKGRAVLNTYMGGGDVVAQVGVGEGTNFNDIGMETIILVVASDLQQEAPIWWLRVKQAAERGARLIVANARPTRLDKFARYKLRYRYGEETNTILTLMNEQGVDTPGKAISNADNLIIFFGSDGLGLSGSTMLGQACGELLLKTGHSGRANNGLIGVWNSGNIQGAWDMGFRPVENLAATLIQAKTAYIVASDPCGDEPGMDSALEGGAFLIVQDLFMTKTAQKADIVLPAVPPTEREGSYTSGERRVQRFFPATTPIPGGRADFAIAAQLGKRMGLELEGRAPALIMQQIAVQIRGYANVTYQKLGETKVEWPMVGDADLYYGGTAHKNHQGQGMQIDTSGSETKLGDMTSSTQTSQPEEVLRVVPITRLFDQGTTLAASELLKGRTAKAALRIHPETALKFGLSDNALQSVEVSFNHFKTILEVELDETVPPGVALLPRSMGVPITAAEVLQIHSFSPVNKD